MPGVERPAFSHRGCGRQRGREAPFIDGGFAPGEGHAVIGGKYNQGLFIETVFLEDFDEAGDSLINPGDTLVVLG